MTSKYLTKWAEEESAAAGVPVGNILGGTALGGIAASPFLGMIGADPITKDPYRNKNIKKFTLEQLERMAQPGDVIASTTNKWGRGAWKIPQTLSSGSDFYHSESVYGGKGNKPNPKGKKYTMTGGMMGGEFPYNPGGKPTRAQFERRLSEMSNFADDDIVLLRPKQTLTKEQMEAFHNSMHNRSALPYDRGQAVKNYLRDIFVPKITKKSPATNPNCPGDICSTLPSSSLEEAAQRRAHPKIESKHMMPADYLREQSAYDVLGATNKYGPALKNPRLTRVLARGGLGAGMAGTAYGLYKEPEIMAGVAGAAAVPSLAQKYMERKQMKTNPVLGTDTVRDIVKGKLPNYKDFVDQLLNENGPPDAIKHFKRRTIPLALLGGLGAYGAAKGVTKGIGLLRDRLNEKDKPVSNPTAALRQSRS
jgi:hypothetical protein